MVERCPKCGSTYVLMNAMDGIHNDDYKLYTCQGCYCRFSLVARHCSTCRTETDGAPLCDKCAAQLRNECADLNEIEIFCAELRERLGPPYGVRSARSTASSFKKMRAWLPALVAELREARLDMYLAQMGQLETALEVLQLRTEIERLRALVPSPELMLRLAYDASKRADHADSDAARALAQRIEEASTDDTTVDL